MYNIKACVVCGKEAELLHCQWRGVNFCYVQCIGCCMTGEVCETSEDAIDLWNKMTLEKWLEE
jgi:hypothetical protein